MDFRSKKDGTHYPVSSGKASYPKKEELRMAGLGKFEGGLKVNSYLYNNHLL